MSVPQAEQGGSPIPCLTDGITPTAAGDDTKQTVLVVDDDARLRDVLCTVLAPLDCEILEAGSGEQALTALLQHKASVIVLDVNMPGMDGFETAQLIREAGEFTSTPIIFLTGQADENDPHRGYDLGAVDFLLKPVSARVLYAKVKALLELDQSFARLRAEAANLHEQQLQAARAAEIRQRDEVSYARRRERLGNAFAAVSLDLADLEKAIVTEFSQAFDAQCLLRVELPGREWHDTFSHPEPVRMPELQAGLVEQLAGKGQSPMSNPSFAVEELIARGQRVGVLCLGRAAGQAFSETEVAQFRATCVATGLAISNALLFRVQAEYAAVMQATADAILAVDASGAIRSCNKAATALLAGHSDTLIGRSIAALAVDAHQERLGEQLATTLATHHQVSLEMTLAAHDGRPVDVLLTLSPIGDSVDLNVAVVVHDLTEIKEAQRVISHLATHDPLTNLANRRQLNDRLAELSQQLERGALTALLYMDVNKFKTINDTYGHDAGDELLVEVAQRLQSAVRSDALACRIGGDEFIVLLEDVASTNAAVVAGNRILERIQEQPVRCKNATLHPSVSMGISCLGASAHTPEELLSQADMAMFEAKKNRLDQCVLYTDLIGSRHKGQVNRRAELSGAIVRSEFRVAYQPIVNAATADLFGLEALVRWRVGDEEMPAKEIIALAESAGQIGPLGRWIVTRSVEDYASLGRTDVKLHVNLSPVQVLDGSFLDHLIDAQQANRISPECICLELTERTFNGDPGPARAMLRRARDLGFRLAIQDFGVEHASMTNLLHVPVDWLKIDRSFVAEVEENERVQRLVRSQIAMADCMEIDLIAAGVETQEQADWLRAAGCVLQQGFLYAHPIEATDLEAEVQNWAAVR